MKIQANEQTKDGVWGVMLSGWEDGEKPVFMQWLTKEEAGALASRLAPMSFVPATTACAPTMLDGKVETVTMAGGGAWLPSSVSEEPK